MFNTLVYIPTILAYTFVILLLVILGFVIIYISHKIYTTLYDNIPVAELPSKYLVLQQVESLTKSSDTLILDSVADAQQFRKLKTALRIIVTLEPCYLAYMVFESKLLFSNPGTLSRLYKIACSSANSSSTTSASDPTANKQVFIKYFDNLASIPCSRDLLKCDNFKFNN